MLFLSCANKYCNNQINLTESSLYKSDGKNFCSFLCINLMKIQEIIDNQKGVFDKTSLIEVINQNFTVFEKQYSEYIDKQIMEKKKSMIQENVSMMGRSQFTVPQTMEPEIIKINPMAQSEIPISYYNFDYLVPIWVSTISPDSISMKEIIEFASAIYSISTKKVIKQFHKFVTPTNFNYIPEIKFEGYSKKQILSGTDFKSLLNSFDEFLHEAGLFHSKFSIIIMDEGFSTIEFLKESQTKSVKLESYWKKFININRIISQIIISENYKHIWNKAQLESLLLNNDISNILKNTELICKILGVKYKKRVIDNLELIGNFILLIEKLIDKGYNINSEKLANLY